MKKFLFFITLISLTSIFNCKAQEKSQIQPTKANNWHERAERREREIFKRLDIDRLFSFDYEFDSTGKKFTSVSVDYYDLDKYLIRTETYINRDQIPDSDSVFKMVWEFKYDSLKNLTEFTNYSIKKGEKPDTIRHLYEYGQNSLMTKWDNECLSYTFNDKGLVSEETTSENDKVTAYRTFQYDDKNREIKKSRYAYENGKKVLKDETLTIYDDINRKLEEIITIYEREGLTLHSILQFDNEDRIIESTSFHEQNSIEKSVVKYDENGLVSEGHNYINDKLSNINVHKYLKNGEDYSFDFYGVIIE